MAYCAGRSNGTPYSPSVVHSPCQSGSAHAVRARHVVSLFVRAPVRSNSLPGGDWELDEVPAVRDRAHVAQTGAVDARPRSI